MENVSVQLNNEGFGKFYLTESGIELAKMEVSVSENYLTVYHTEVSPLASGRGLGKMLFQFMVEYAQSNQIKIIPLCVFVKKQMDREPSKYEDLVAKN